MPSAVQLHICIMGNKFSEHEQVMYSNLMQYYHDGIAVKICIDDRHLRTKQ